MKIKNILWVLPFIFFLLGYYFVYLFLHKRVVVNPIIIGKTIQEATNILSAKGLGLRLLKELEDPDLPAGTVLKQIPKSGQNVRPNQHIFVIVSKKPKIEKAPNFLGEYQNDIDKKISKTGLNIKKIWQNSFYPMNCCIAQNPQPNCELKNNKILLYFSAGKNDLFIVPNLKDSLIKDINNHLNRDNVVIEAFYNNEKLSLDDLQEYRIIDQKPMPGSIVDLSKKLYLQVLVDY